MSASPRSSRRRLAELLLLLAIFGLAPSLQGQTEAPLAPRWKPRSWSLFSEYSPDSSHIILGVTQQRIFVTAGASLAFRLVRNRYLELSWTPEIRPLIAESDPVLIGWRYSTCSPGTGPGGTCVPESGSYRIPHEIPVMSPMPATQNYSATINGQTYYQDYAFHYGRRWTYIGGLSPIGLQAAFRPGRRLQPLLGLTGGFAASPRDVPMFFSSAFNFTFTFGGGIRIWHDRTHATQIEYRLQHFSNADIGSTDPGIDSQMLHVSYLWGRR